MYLIALGCIALFYVLVQSQTYTGGFFLFDANVYACHAQRIAEGGMVYKDFFHANMPLVPYWAYHYNALSFGSLETFYLFASFEAVAIMGILFALGRELFKSDKIALIMALTFLATDVVLRSSRVPFFLLLPLLFVLAAYYATLKKRLVIAGVLAGLAFCTKIYLAPLIGALAVALYLKKKQTVIPFLLAFIGSVIVLLFPFALFAGKDMLQQVFGVSLVRSGGTNRWQIVGTFFSYQFVHVLLLLYPVIYIRRYLFLGLGIIGTALFLTFFKDIFLVYFSILMPLAALGLGHMLHDLKGKAPPIAGIIATAIALGIPFLFSIQSYLANINNARMDKSSVLAQIAKYKPEQLYGIYGLTQGVSYETGIPVVQKLCDLQPRLFNAGILDKKAITEDIITHRTLVMLPAYVESTEKGSLFGKETVDVVALTRSCKMVHAEPFSWNGLNSVLFYMCGR